MIARTTMLSLVLIACGPASSSGKITIIGPVACERQDGGNTRLMAPVPSIDTAHGAFITYTVCGPWTPPEPESQSQHVCAPGDTIVCTPAGGACISAKPVEPTWSVVPCDDLVDANTDEETPRPGGECFLPDGGDDGAAGWCSGATAFFQVIE